jgi:hypothetical protein
MTITQTVEIPPSRWLNIEVPREVPTGLVILTLVSDTDNIRCSRELFMEVLPIYISHPKLSFVDCYLAVLVQRNRETPPIGGQSKTLLLWMTCSNRQLFLCTRV